MERIIKRGDIYYAELNPVIGSEQGGTRPVLIISNDIGNKHSPTVIIAAITSRVHTKAKLPTHTAVSNYEGFDKDSVILLEQIRTIDKQRLYKEVNGKYPSMNCTVGKEIIDNPEATIGFFEQFGNRITFSRMIGKQGISLPDFNAFLNKAMERLNVRTGGYDCTMYGGMCGAGMDNIFYANGKIFICGNCIDLPFSMPYDTPLNEVSFDVIDFDRSCCFKEVFTG